MALFHNYVLELAVAKLVMAGESEQFTTQEMIDLEPKDSKGKVIGTLAITDKLGFGVQLSPDDDEIYSDIKCGLFQKRFVDLYQMRGSEAQLVVSFRTNKKTYRGLLHASELQRLFEDSEPYQTLRLLSEAQDTKQVAIALLELKFNRRVPDQSYSMTELMFRSLIELKDLKIKDAMKLALSNQSMESNETQTREFVLELRMNKQAIEFNIENPEEEYKKAHLKNQALFLLNNTEMEVLLEERFYRVEKDYSAMTRGDSLLGKSFAAMVKSVKTRIHPFDPKPLVQDSVDLRKEISAAAKGCLGMQFKEIKIKLAEGIVLTGKLRVIRDHFSLMPRGQITLGIDSLTSFKFDKETEYKDLIFLLTKQVNALGETLVYKVTQKEIRKGTVPALKFDTYHYDDFIKIEVFKGNSTQKPSKIGKAFVKIRDLNCQDLTADVNRSANSRSFLISPVEFEVSRYSERKKPVNGQIFVSAKYTPRADELFYSEFRNLVHNMSPLTEESVDRFEHFNELLCNEFIEASQHGTLMLELLSVAIPQDMQTAEADIEGAVNRVFMLKIKIGNEMKNIFIGSPDVIYGDQEESVRIFTKVQSLRDLVTVEFYDVLQEEDFDPKVRQPLSNLRLLSQKTFEVKDLPFDKFNFVEEYSALMPIEFCKKVAEMKFCARFSRSLPMDLICQPLEPHTGYMLNSRLVFDRATLVQKDPRLDEAEIMCYAKNMTQDPEKIAFQQKLNFQKTVIHLGNLYFRLNDLIEIGFYVKDPFNQPALGETQTLKKEPAQLKPFSTYSFRALDHGFETLDGCNCYDQLLPNPLTWRALSSEVHLNYIHDGSYGGSSETFNKVEARVMNQRQRARPRGEILDDVKRNAAVLNPMKSLNSGKVSNEDKIILKSVAIEFEVRKSHLIDAYSQGYLASSVCEVQFDEVNVQDLLNSGEFEEGCTLKMEVVSKDKNSIKTRIREKPLVEYMERVIPQRLFETEDVIQINVINLVNPSHCIQLKPMDLPLTHDQPYTHWVQIGVTSQLKIILQLRQDERLQKRIDEQRNVEVKSKQPEKDPQEQENEKRRQLVQIQKQYQEIVKAAQDPSMPLPERIAAMKQAIHLQKQKNKELVTKQNRLKFECEKSALLTQKAIEFKDHPKPRRVHKEESSLHDLGTGPIQVRGGVAQGLEDGRFKHRQTLCSCGNQDPEFKGYCLECVEKLKLKYEKLEEKNELLLKEKKELSKKTNFDVEEKLRVLKHKMAQYGAVVEASNLFDVVTKHEQLVHSDENKELASLKAEMKAAEQEVKILKAKQEIEEADFEKQKGTLKEMSAQKEAQYQELQGDVEQLKDKKDAIRDEIGALQKDLVWTQKFLFRSQNPQFAF